MGRISKRRSRRIWKRTWRRTRQKWNTDQAGKRVPASEKRGYWENFILILGAWKGLTELD